MKNLCLLLLLTLFIQASCSDNPPIDPEPQLPAITTTGENTFGCLVNGEIWLPEGPQNPLSSNPDAKYDEAFGVLKLTGEKIDESGGLQEIMFIRINPSSIGEYEFDYIQSWTYRNRTIPDCKYYYLDTSRYNFVNISRLDKIEDIISGTFDFKVINRECQDTLHFSEGRFDLIYHL